jgi:hypothetical protein
METCPMCQGKGKFESKAELKRKARLIAKTEELGKLIKQVPWQGFVPSNPGDDGQQEKQVLALLAEIRELQD